jgi:putative alpha-1,2-mannosidase
MAERIGQIENQKQKRKNQKMSTEQNPEKGKKKENEMNFEFIDENDIESVKRGRKAQVDGEMVAFFAKAKVGQSIKVAVLALSTEMTKAEADKEKAKHNAKIRSHAKAAGWAKVAIKWDIKGFPVAKRIA